MAGVRAVVLSERGRGGCDAKRVEGEDDSSDVHGM